MPTTTAIPGAGGVWLNPLQQYVSPSGNDANDGLGWSTAKKYIGTAWDFLQARGGGELHFAHGTYTHADQRGLWLRDDGLPVTGWHVASGIRMIGHGPAFLPFSYGPTAGMIGGGLYTQGRFNPPLWICASQRNVMSFENVGFNADPGNPGVLQSSSTAIRLGWDYQRNAALDIKFQNITSWARVTSGSPPGVATVTVTASTYPVTSMSRASGIVTIVLTSTDPVFSWRGGSVGTVFDIAGTPAGFGAGTFAVTAIVSGSSFQYPEAGADTALTPATATITSTNALVNDRIEVVSTSVEVPSTMYKVTGVLSGRQLTLTDYYGQGAGRTPTVTVANPGKLALQQRTFTQSVGLLSFIRPSAGQLVVADAGASTGELGPTVDFGATTDGRIVFREMCIGGGGPNTGSGVNVLDPDRGAWLLADGGSQGTCGFFVKHGRPYAGGIRIWEDGWVADLDDVQADIGVPLIPPPLLESCSPTPAPAAGLIATRSFQTDRGTVADPDFVVSNMLPANVYIQGAEIVRGPGTVVSGESSFGWANNRVTSPLALLQAGYWADRRLAGQHPSNYRVLGLLQSARYQNLVTQDSTGWTHVGTTITTGLPDPFGGTAAIGFAGAGALAVTLATSDGAARAVGDRWALGCWMRAAGGLHGASTGLGVIVLSYDHGTFNGPATIYGNQVQSSTPFSFDKDTPFLGDGEWQWCVCSGTLATLNNAGAASSAKIQYTTAMTIYRPTLVKVPNGDMTDNEFAEFVLTLRHQSDYLPARATGTDNGVPFVGHGGIVVGDATIATSTLRLNTSASAPATAGGANFAELRWNAGTGKIEYCKPGGAWTTLV